MRIEKVNENQIRCYLTREEMETRQLHLKELAYGTEKARSLFHELILKARRQCGFDPQNMPVMVEAVPMYDDSLVLIITRVENPEELDTRFSSFAPSVKSASSDAESREPSALGRLLDTIRQDLGEDKAPGKRRSGKKASGSGQDTGTASPPAEHPLSGVQLFTFRSLLEASAAASAAGSFKGTGSLYRDPADGLYYLFLRPDPGADTDGSGSWLTAFSEFGSPSFITPAREQHLREHCVVLCTDDAVQRLAALGDPDSGTAEE